MRSDDPGGRAYEYCLKCEVDVQHSFLIHDQVAQASIPKMRDHEMHRSAQPRDEMPKSIQLVSSPRDIRVKFLLKRCIQRAERIYERSLAKIPSQRQL